jgi:uncharacterized protein (DUF427 family)
MPEMKIPGPDHPITVTANPKRLQVNYQDHVIADSEATLTLKESTYPAVSYFPRRDVEMDFLSRTDRMTYCPYKGEAHYFTIVRDGRIAENAVWTYETPYPAMELIKDYVAFYPNHVDVQEVVGGPGSDAVREAILHTDAGAGQSQRAPWAATVDEPSGDLEPQEEVQ